MYPLADWIQVFEGGWSSYEEGDQIEIWETPAGDFWVHREASYVMGDGPIDEWYQVTFDEVIELVEEYGEECLDELH